jgi:hypothetical protein
VASAKAVSRTFIASLLTLVAMVAAPSRAAAQDVHLLVITGVGGDEEHVKKFAAWSTAIVDAAA